MLRTTEDLVRAFAEELSFCDVRRLEAYLGEDVRVHFDEAGEFIGRRAALAFWRRLFQSYSVFDMHIVKLVAEDNLVIAETIYLLGSGRGAVTSVRAITVFEIEADVIVSWTDRADLADVPVKERERWRRLGSARW